mmetsp:Transcript_11111/g.26727  ORF Transcript_11111/g.26727 Transcript_11111/m.26727 type:complete len:205 (-) Transcript_11111:51-665(-)
MATAWILRMATTPLAETCSTEIACSFAGRTLSTGSTTFNPSACSSSMPHSPRASHAPSSGGASTRMTVRSLLCPVTAYRCIPLCPTTPAQLSDTTPPAVEAGSTGAGALSGLCNSNPAGCWETLEVPAGTMSPRASAMMTSPSSSPGISESYASSLPSSSSAPATRTTPSGASATSVTLSSNRRPSSSTCFTSSSAGGATETLS